VSALHAHSATLFRLGQVYKQVNAPFGELARSALTVLIHALENATLNDATYTQLESKIASWTNQRDSLAAQMKAVLEAAEFNG
jgi:hypothetical protein